MLRGVFPPLPTPFTDDALDVDVLRETVAALMQTRLSGLLVLGTNGESFLVEPSEADTIVRTTRAPMLARVESQPTTARPTYSCARRLRTRAS